MGQLARFLGRSPLVCSIGESLSRSTYIDSVYELQLSTCVPSLLILIPGSLLVNVQQGVTLVRGAPSSPHD